MAERRITTVLFGDLVSFTTLSEQRDPEEVRELLSAYFGVARTVVGRYGGTIEKFIGDAVMAVWGVPVTHEDDAERAVRAGIELVAEVTALGASVGAPGLAMRVGIVTGAVAVTLGATQEGMVAGDAVNTAARVQGAASPGTVWVDDETRALASAAVTFTARGEHALKGKDAPVRLFEVDDVIAAVGGLQRVDGLEAPMTGRDRELRSVKDGFHATAEDGRARLVLVTGPAGVGKSRLGWEFEKYVDGLSADVLWHRGRCLSYGGGAAMFAFAQMMRDRLGLAAGEARRSWRPHHRGGTGRRRRRAGRLGLAAGEDPAVVEASTAAAVQAVAADAQEADWLVPRLLALVSESTAGGASFVRGDLFAAWATFLERLAGTDPVVLLLEDAQHADDGLLDLLETLVTSCRAPLFVLVLARPELEQQRPTLAAGRRSSTTYLEPLTAAVMGTLVDALVDGLPAGDPRVARGPRGGHPAVRGGDRPVAHRP